MNKNELITFTYEEIIDYSFSLIFLLILLFLLLKNSSIFYSFCIRKKYKSNPNSYLYKNLKKDKESREIISNFLYAFTTPSDPNRSIFTDPCYAKEKDIYINGFRYLLGLISLDFFNEKKTKDILSIVFNHLWRSQNKSTLHHWQRDENVSLKNMNMIIWDWQLIDTEIETYGSHHIENLIFKNVVNDNIKKIPLVAAKDLKSYFN